MSLNIKTATNIYLNNYKNLIIDEIQNEGLILLDKNELKFKETYNLTNHFGKNRNKIFIPLIKGNIELKPNKKYFIWKLNIDAILIKSVSIFVLCFFMFLFILDASLLFSSMLSLIFGGIIFLINFVLLNQRVKRLSNKIESKIKAH